MDPSTTSFSLTTALSYSSARSPSPFSLLPRHLKRLKDAHENLARDLPGSWCSRMGMPKSEQMEAELDRAVEEARKKGIEGDLRIRLNVLETGAPFAEAFPLSPMPSYPVRLVFDDRPTAYDDPFLLNKTTKRAKYDEARERQGAVLTPSSNPSAPPFDVIMFNPSGEVTETTISNIAFRLSGDFSAPYVTPQTSCGILPGVQRAELLEKGEIVEGVVQVNDVKAAFEAGTCEIICFNGVRGVFSAFIAKESMQ